MYISNNLTISLQYRSKKDYFFPLNKSIDWIVAVLNFKLSPKIDKIKSFTQVCFVPS